MHRHTDGSGLVRQGSGHRLPNPPCRIGRQLEALLRIELLYTLDQAQISLLHKVQKAHAAAGIALGNGNHKSKICLNEALLRHLIALLLPCCQTELLLCTQQRHGADLLQIHPHRILGADSLQKVYCIQVNVLPVLLGEFLLHVLQVIRIRAVIRTVFQLLQRRFIHNRIDFNAPVFDQTVDIVHLLFCEPGTGKCLRDHIGIYGVFIGSRLLAKLFNLFQ